VSNEAHQLETKQLIDAHHFLDKDTFIIPDVYVRQCTGTYPDPVKDYRWANDFISICQTMVIQTGVGVTKYVEASYYKYLR